MGRVLLLAVCFLLLSCAPGATASAPPTPADVLARQLAASDAGGAGRLLENDRRVLNYRALLGSLQQTCREDVHRLSDELLKARRTVMDTGKVVTVGQVLAYVDGAVPEGSAAAGCLERLATWTMREMNQRTG